MTDELLHADHPARQRAAALADWFFDGTIDEQTADRAVDAVAVEWELPLTRVGAWYHIRLAHLRGVIDAHES